MQVKFLSVKPEDLIQNQYYLVGRVSLVDEVDWYTALFDGSLFHYLENNGDLKIDHPQEFMFSLDGFESDYLIFKLPEVGKELEDLF